MSNKIFIMNHKMSDAELDQLEMMSDFQLFCEKYNIHVAVCSVLESDGNAHIIPFGKDEKCATADAWASIIGLFINEILKGE